MHKRSATVPLQAPAAKTMTIAAAWIGADAGSNHHSTRPAADPNVPGANGTYPVPSAVASASAMTFMEEESLPD